MTPEPPESIPDQVRIACARVAERARSVRIEEGAIAAYAKALPATVESTGTDPTTEIDGDREARVGLVICLDAINFGSGWWPTIRKRPAHSGYFTIAAGLTERFRDAGAWPAAALTRLSAAEIAKVLSQDADHPLMADFAASLRDVGAHVLADHGGRFEAVLDAAAGSALALADLLAGWDAFADVSVYEGRPVPFFKRAQLAAADIERAGLADFPDRDRLTAFADNLVPHVLRLDGVLRLTPELTAAIEAGELLVHGSFEEVELRACAVQAVELLAAATGGRLAPPQIDNALWNRGQSRRYKAVPRPRSRNTAY
ncbi:MAG: queuosine salvage family protein [Solirubrobacterales bacterium]